MAKVQLTTAKNEFGELRGDSCRRFCNLFSIQSHRTGFDQTPRLSLGSGQAGLHENIHQTRRAIPAMEQELRHFLGNFAPLMHAA